ncbi:MAG TPA: DUF4260 domain-containing protein [Opitutaceae bacterium]|nr:DUF4260 domain-containing protein [Opitutaceae bacterium]
MKSSLPKFLLQLEGLMAVTVACVAYRQLGASWFEFAVLFLAPDISIASYFFGQNIGAIAYNSGHTYLAPFLLAAIGHLAGLSAIMPIALIWVAHIGFDRLLGYGLKYETGFKHTHLNRL